MTKKLLIVSLLILIVNVTVYGQFNLGISGGLNNSTYYVENEDVTSRWLWHAGINAEYSLTDYLSLKAEPMLLKKGGIQEEQGNDPEFTFDQLFLEVPLFVKFSFGTANKAYLLAGPSIGFKLSSEFEAKINDILFTADLNNVTETIDFGIAVGGGFDFNIYQGKLFIETKYTWGLTNLAKDGTYIAKAGPLEIEQQLDAEVSKYNSRSFQISIGYAISL
jgi:hypothetical protein